jgi:hypothetical protein
VTWIVPTRKKIAVAAEKLFEDDLAFGESWLDQQAKEQASDEVTSPFE